MWRVDSDLFGFIVSQADFIEYNCKEHDPTIKLGRKNNMTCPLNIHKNLKMNFKREFFKVKISKIFG